MQNLRRGDYIGYRNSGKSWHCEFIRYLSNHRCEVYLLKQKTYVIVPLDKLVTSMGPKPMKMLLSELQKEIINV